MLMAMIYHQWLYARPSTSIWSGVEEDLLALFLNALKVGGLMPEPLRCGF